MRNIIPKAVLSAALIAGVTLPAAARFENLRPDVERHLSTKGISEADVDKISILPRRRAGEGSDIIRGYNATVSFHNCDGHLVISMNRVGHVKGVYSRGACSFPGVPSY